MVLICLAIIIWLAVTLSRENTSNTYNTYDTPVTYPTQNQLIASTAKAFLITCIDFRLIDD
jgi:TRAP-type C4-dicarboxylate transport system permease small subunit